MAKLNLQNRRFFSWFKYRVRRFAWLIPVVSFLAGWASFVLVERDKELARVIALLALVGWVWLLAEPLIVRRLLKVQSDKVRSNVTNFFSQSIQQEILFFSLPFLVAATQLAAWGQVAFTAGVICAAALSTIDPWYEKYVSHNRAVRLAFHAGCCFVASLVILPVVLKLPVGKTLIVAQAFLVLWIVITLPSLLTRAPSRKRGALLFVGLCTLPILIWLFRANIPPAGLQVTSAVIAKGVVEHEPVSTTTTLDKAELGNGVYAYVAIKAPRSLRQTISFKWRHQNYSETISATIIGGRTQGYRTYSVKRNFPANRIGKWYVDVLTAQGQLLMTLTFWVTD